MVCKGYLEGNKDIILCGCDEWVCVFWDKVFEFVVNEMKCVCEVYGLSVIFGGFYGWYSLGVLYVACILFKCYLIIIGGFVDVKGDYLIGVV